MIVVKRKIGSIALDVTVSEKHTDTLEITQFPVLSGAVITDHAYKLPMQLTIKAGQGTGPGQYAYGVNPETIITADIPNDNGQYTFEEGLGLHPWNKWIPLQQRYLLWHV